MRNLCIRAWAPCSIAVGLCLSGAAIAAGGDGPYYATPSWDQKLPAATRFIVLTNWNSEAVLDRETGLVWERVPSTSGRTWFSASLACLYSNTGGRTGWRLPALPELMSLVDRSQSNPALPSGHPFTVLSFAHWSATTVAFDATRAFLVSLYFGNVDFTDKPYDGTHAWCVRGGPGGDVQ